MCAEKINLLDMDPKSLSIFFYKLGEKSFRYQQVMQWVYQRHCDDFDHMLNLSKNLRIQLNKIAEISAPMITNEQQSTDGTIKWIMQVGNQYIETVYIPEHSRATLCISSQIGCLLNCNFCATAQQGFNRNLKVSEIVGQVWRVRKLIQSDREYIKRLNINRIIPITHIVFMGMGEPLLNLLNVVSAIRIMLSDFGFGLSKNHIILSTAGIVPGIDKLKNMIDISLAISLHAPNDSIRNKIMPINQKYNIKCLLRSVQGYLNCTTANRKKVTIEYILLDHVNDEAEHAHELAMLILNLSCKVNLIPWNVVPNTPYLCSSNSRINKFYKILLDYGITTTIRKVRGIDINAACGQLRGVVQNRVRCREL